MTPHLPPDDPDDEEYDPRLQTQRVYYRSRDENSEARNSANFRTVLDGLMLAGIVGLVTVVWQLNTSVAVLGNQVKYMGDQITQLQGRVK
jgi:hypothetical protein